MAKTYNLPVPRIKCAGTLIIYTTLALRKIFRMQEKSAYRSFFIFRNISKTANDFKIPRTVF